MALKRAFDIVVASVGLVVTSPITLSIGFSMAVAYKSSPLYRQIRVGLNNKPFTIYKIKSMNDSKDEQGFLLSDERRTSRLGRFLRKTHLDELPQLLNILKGDMSIVGPRPVHANVKESKDKKRHLVRPGLTGMVQISGKNLLSHDECLELDHAYVDNNSLSKDFMICVRTPMSIVKFRHAPHFKESAQISHTPNQEAQKHKID